MNMNDMTKKLYPVTGMHCAACAGNVEKIVRKQEGVENASVNLATATLAVTYNPDIVSPQQLKEAVMKIGFDLIIDEDNSVQEQEEAEVFGLTPSQICDTLHLKRPIYRQSAVFGHFGRKEFPWEKTDKAEQLRDTVL